MFNFINETSITAATDFDTFKNGQLNHLLGQDGAPKYSSNELKSKNKAALGDELRALLLEHEASKPKSGSKTSGTKGAKMTVSKNVASAASKLTNTLKAIVAGKKTVEQAREIVAADEVLAAYWGERLETDLARAAAGLRPSQARAEAAAANRAAKAEAKANKPARVKVTTEVEIPDEVVA